MRGVLFFLFVVVWQWTSLNIVCNVLITDKGQPLLRLITWGVIWFIPVVIAFIIWCKSDRKVKRVFTLENVYLTNGSGLGACVEAFIIDDRFNTYDIYPNTKEFFIDLEDTDDGVGGEDGVLYDCRPRYVRTLKELAIHSRSDILHVQINKAGVVTVDYIGRDALVTKSEIVWHVSEEKKDGK
jgi:hypothetical protein